MYKKLLCAVVAGIAFVSPAATENRIPEGYYPFPLKWDDDLFGTATDVSFLNTKPAGKNGRIIVKNGHFHESDTGNRIRFIGIGIGGDGLFEMDHRAAEKVAARLAKAGVNIVRFHNLDGSDRASDTLIDFSKPGSVHFNEKHLDTLDYFFAQLKRQGIYTVMGLKVNRTLLPADGAPAGTKAAKRVDRFNKEWIESQKLWAKQLLTHKNPYTGTTLADDPAVVSLELNNESSLLFENLNWIEKLHPHHKEELTELWNGWLLEKYKTDQALNTSWRAGLLPPGKNILNAENRWRVENKNNVKILSGGFPAQLEAEIGKRTEHDWQAQLQLPGLTLKNDTVYTVEFDIRAVPGGNIRASVTLDKKDWKNCGLETTFRAGPEKRRRKFIFKAKNTEPEHVRLSFGVGHVPGTVEISNVTIRSGVEYKGVGSGSSLLRRNIPLPESGNSAQRADLLDFMVHLDRRYADIMRTYLKRELNVKPAIIDTQIDWGGLSGLHREKEMEYIDAHAYWGHPEFTDGSWNFHSGKWKILNMPQSVCVAGGGWCPLEQFSRYRVADKPFSISEHDYPYPSDYAVEMMPLLVCVALRQDWDMLHLFIHGTFGKRGRPEGISHMFDQTNHPGKIGFFPAAALIFRKGMFEPAEREIQLRLPENPHRHFNNRFDRAWGETDIRRDLLTSRMSISPEPIPTEKPEIRAAVRGFGDAPAPMRAWNEGKSTFFTARAPQCAVITGHFGRKSVDVGGFRVEAKPFPGDFGAAVLVSRDDVPLEDSSSLLLTIAARFENSGVVWNRDRTATLNSPDTWGHPPVLAAGMNADVSFRTSGPRKVYALDNIGRRKTEIPAVWKNGKLTLKIRPEQRAMHYEVAK